MNPQAFSVRTFWLLGTCAFASLASMRVCDAMLPALAQEFATSTGAAGAAISSFAMAYGLLQLFYGPLGDRFGKVRVVGCATLACTAGSVAATCAQDLRWLVAARILSGVAAAGIVPLTMAWIGDGVPYARRQEVLARLLGATVFGMIAGQWLGGLIAETLGWRLAFVLLAMVFLVAGTMLLHHDRQRAAVHVVPAGGALKGMRQVFAQPWARTVLGVTAVEGALAYSALAFVPSHVHSRFGLSMPVAGAIVALYGVGGLVYSRCAKPLLRKLAESGLAMLGASSLALAFLTIAWSPVWQWTLPACLLAGFGFYALHNTLQTHATQMAPAARGTAVSLFVCLLFLGQSAGVAMAGWLIDRYSAPLVFAIAGFGLLALGLSFAALLARRSRTTPETAA